MFSSLSRTNFAIWITFNLSSANALNLDWSKILSFGTGLSKTSNVNIHRTDVLQVNPFPSKPWFLRVCRKSLLKTLCEKEKLLAMSNFSFSHSVFYLFREVSAIFIKFKIVVCKLFQFWKSLNFVVWERVKKHKAHRTIYRKHSILT